MGEHLHLLYKLTFSNGKCYIGQTVRTIRKRITQHRHSAIKQQSLLPVPCAWRKHGEPVVEVIGEFNTPEELHAAEIADIIRFGTLAPNGYNIGYGGETAPSKNPEVAKKISEKGKGRLHSDETKVAMSEGIRGRWQDEEYRAKVLAGVERSWTPEVREKRGRDMKRIWEEKKAAGWTMPESQKEKMRNKVFSEETRKKMSLASKGKPKAPRSEKTRQKLSEATKKHWQNQAGNTGRIAAAKAGLKDYYANMTPEKYSEFCVIRQRAAATRKAKRAATQLPLI